MPLYEYQCGQCGRFEVIRKFSDPPLIECPTCGKPIEKLLSSPAIQFKGSGWYITDYARKSSGEGGKSESGKGESGKNDSSKGESSKGESSKGESSKGESGKSDGGSKDSGGDKPAAATPATTSKTGTDK
jgi:putative FmdB family regulatory protein